jgi:ankyrin repeat protein
MWATAEGHLDVMKALLDGGANANAISKTDVTALMFTARHGSIDAARLLLDRGANINAQSRIVNDSALGGGISKTQQGGATTLLRAVVRGHVPLAIFLLDRGADPNLSGTGYAALHWAAGKWEASINKEYSFEDGEWSSLYGIRSRADKEKLIRALVAHGADVNAVAKTEPTRPGATLLVLIDAQVRLGVTPFYIAAMSADADTMKLLLSLGANPTIPSANKTTPLMVAAGRIRIDYESTVREEDALAATKVALEAGNDVNAANNMGETPLHAAAIAGWNSVVEYLVSKGASLTAVDKKGKTPRMQAEEGNGHATSLTQKRPETAALLAKLEEKAR